MDLGRMREVSRWLEGVLLASVFADPESPGLSHAELEELAKQRGYGAGELQDAISKCVRNEPTREGRYLPSSLMAGTRLIDFNKIHAGDPRNIEAFKFVCTSFQEAERHAGRDNAKLPRDVLVDRAAQKGLDGHAVQVACASYILAEQIAPQPDRDLLHWRGMYAHPKDQQRRRVTEHHPVTPVLGVVRDIVARRTDGRPKSGDPFKAFADKLEQLGYPNNRIWWNQTVREATTLNPLEAPTAVLVLSAALGEGALSFLVRYARKATNGAAFGSNTFDEGQPKKNWSLEALAKAAKHDTAQVIDQLLMEQCIRLNEDRQRIHGARYIDTAVDPTKIATKDHEAEAALQTVKRLVSKIVEWIAAHPL